MSLSWQLPYWQNVKKHICSGWILPPSTKFHNVSNLFTKLKSLSPSYKDNGQDSHRLKILNNYLSPCLCMLFIMRAVIKKNTIQNVNVRIEFPRLLWSCVSVAGKTNKLLILKIGKRIFRYFTWKNEEYLEREPLIKTSIIDRECSSGMGSLWIPSHKNTNHQINLVFLMLKIL